MKTTKINIQEVDFELMDSNQMLCKIIDNQINNYKLKYLSDWTKDRTKCSTIEKEKINALKANKEKLKALFEEFKGEDALVDFNISIDVRIKEKEFELA